MSKALNADGTPIHRTEARPMDEPTLVYPKGYNHRRGCSRTHPVTHPCDNGTPVRAEPGARGLDVEDVMDAEHRYCVQVEGEWALGHEVERHRAQAEFIIARLTDPEPAT